MPNKSLEKTFFETSFRLLAFRLVTIISAIDLNLSKSEIRRLIRSNGIKINNNTIKDESFIISKELLEKNKFIKLSIGKKKHFKIII